METHNSLHILKKPKYILFINKNFVFCSARQSLSSLIIPVFNRLNRSCVCKPKKTVNFYIIFTLF